VKGLTIVAIGLAAWCVGSAQAAVIAFDNWNDGLLDGWSSTNATFPRPSGAAFGSISNSGAGTLMITAGDPGVGNPPREDLFFDTDNLLHDYRPWGGTTNIWALQFDFYSGYASALTNSNLSLYFMSGTNQAWFYDFSVVGPGWGIGYYANLNFADGWYTADERGSAAFLNDLTNVTEIGLALTYPTGWANQQFQIDNFRLMDAPIPEPETYAVLGFAFLSLGITFRRQLRRRWPFGPGTAAG